MTKERKTSKPKSESQSSAKLETKLLENMIALQKINLNMTEKFEKLTSQISELLGLFELTARTFAKQAPVQTSDKDKEFLDKINMLLEQNKTIAKGLTLMELKMREKIYGPAQQPSAMQPSPQTNIPSPRPLPSTPWKPQAS